jgi:hypothetical protein
MAAVSSVQQLQTTMTSTRPLDSASARELNVRPITAASLCAGIMTEPIGKGELASSVAVTTLLDARGSLTHPAFQQAAFSDSRSFDHRRNAPRITASLKARA